ncbi:MAG: hypothetical protein Q9M48_11460 [Rhodobacterales bacterium]|nr:hypothetical protein [Rhodobacterales bacterium]
MDCIRPFAPYLLALVFALIMALFQVPELLGAHPFWALKVIWLGLPVGLVAAFLTGFLGLSKTLRIALFTVATLSAFYVATQGKTVFVNSYAENGLAGRFWYFGWIGTMAAVSGLIAVLIRK